MTLRCAAIGSVVLAGLGCAARAQDKPVNNGTDPTKLTTILQPTCEYLDLVGGFESGPFAPKTAIETVRPGFALRAITTRFAPFQPATTEPPD